MTTAESLIRDFFEAALVHKPNMSSHQIHLYVLGLMARELAFASNNDFSVAQNVSELLEKLNPREVPEKEAQINDAVSIQSGDQNAFKPDVDQTDRSSSSKIGANLMSGLSYAVVTNFISNYPKVLIKDLRDEEGGLLWIIGTKINLEDEKLSAWLIKNKFLWSKEKSAWYFSIL